jgi:hypothetical protein
MVNNVLSIAEQYVDRQARTELFRGRQRWPVHRGVDLERSDLPILRPPRAVPAH